MFMTFLLHYVGPCVYASSLKNESTLIRNPCTDGEAVPELLRRLTRTTKLLFLCLLARLHGEGNQFEELESPGHGRPHNPGKYLSSLASTGPDTIRIWVAFINLSLAAYPLNRFRRISSLESWRLRKISEDAPSSLAH